MTEPLPVPQSSSARVSSHLGEPASTFFIPVKDRSYKHQYANIYFLRLKHFKYILEKRAHDRWKNSTGNPVYVDRVLEVTKAKLSYIIGTVYVEMKLKPNVLHDIARDRSIPAPPPPSNILSEDDIYSLEDESGRITLVGQKIRNSGVITGVVVAVLGMETPTGEFEVVDVCFPGLAPQTVKEDAMEIDQSNPDPWIAFVSGLDVGGANAEAQTQMLVEYLLGEQGGLEDQLNASQISRLVILGNSLAPFSIANTFADEDKDTKKAKRYGYDTSSFSAHPTISLSAHLAALAPSIPIHILPGVNDPSGSILPQQPFPRSMFGPSVAQYDSFECETNPTLLTLNEQTLLCHSGQPISDMLTYVPPNPDSSTMLDVVQKTLRWQHMAPTCPDTLWCHPFFTVDPFIMRETPRFYIVGGQEKFATREIVENDARCRIVLVPKFSDSGLLVCVNLKTAKVKTMRFGVQL